MIDRWLRLLDGQLDQDESEALLRTGLHELEEVLSSRSEATSDVTAIIDTRLSMPWVENTWDNMNQSLVTYFSSEAAHLFTWAAGDPSGGRLEELDKYGADRASALVRRVASEYGSRINAVVQISNGWADDWHFVVCRALLDEAANMYRIRCDVTKFNQERVRVEGPPDAIMSLTSHLLNSLRGVGAEHFHPEVKQAFLDTVDEISSILRDRETEVSPDVLDELPG